MEFNLNLRTITQNLIDKIGISYETNADNKHLADIQEIGNHLIDVANKLDATAMRAETKYASGQQIKNAIDDIFSNLADITVNPDAIDTGVLPIGSDVTIKTHDVVEYGLVAEDNSKLLSVQGKFVVKDFVYGKAIFEDVVATKGSKGVNNMQVNRSVQVIGSVLTNPELEDDIK